MESEEGEVFHKPSSHSEKPHSSDRRSRSPPRQKSPDRYRNDRRWNDDRRDRAKRDWDRRERSPDHRDWRDDRRDKRDDRRDDKRDYRRDDRRDDRRRDYSPRRHHERSFNSKDFRDPSPPRQPSREPSVSTPPDDSELTEEQQMAALMGFGGFETTKGKHVAGTDASAADVKQKRKYRQYMNRRGGFNRPLDKI